jgi:hypothetical protein
MAKKKKEEVEILDAEIIEEITNPDFSNLEVSRSIGRPKKPKGTRKKDFPKFTPEVRETILRLVGNGSPANHAVNIAGVGLESLYRWLERGRHAQNKIDDGYEDTLEPVDVDFANFFVNYNRVSSNPIIELIHGIMKAAKGDPGSPGSPGDPDNGIPPTPAIPPTKPNPNLALRLLEKLDPEQFGQRQAIDMRVAGKVGVGHVHVTADKLIEGSDIAKRLTDEELLLLRGNLQKEKEKKMLPSGNEEDAE